MSLAPASSVRHGGVDHSRMGVHCSQQVVEALFGESAGVWPKLSEGRLLCCADVACLMGRDELY